jgi:hypothetical protein
MKSSSGGREPLEGQYSLWWLHVAGLHIKNKENIHKIKASGGASYFFFFFCFCSFAKQSLIIKT